MIKFLFLIISTFIIKVGITQNFTDPIKSPPALTKFFDIGTTNNKLVVITETGLSGPKFIGLKNLTNDESINFNNLMLKSSVYNIDSKKKEEYFDLRFPSDKVYVLTSYYTSSAFIILAYDNTKAGIQIKEYSIDPTSKKSKWGERVLYTSEYTSSKWISKSKIFIRDNTIFMVTPIFETIEVLKIKSNGISSKSVYDIGFETNLEAISYQKEAILGTFKVSDRTYAFSLENDNTHKTSLLFKGDSVNISYSIKKIADEIIIAGTYSAFKEGTQGFYYNKLFASTLSSKQEKFYPIDSTYVNFLAKQDFRENRLLKSFYFDETLVNDKGDVYIIGSQQFNELKPTTGSLGYGTNAQVYYYSTDLLVGKIDINGVLSYQAIVPRSLKATSFEDIGYYAFLNGNELQILTCDHEENLNIASWKEEAKNINGTAKTNIALISIDNDGNSKRKNHYAPPKGAFYNFNHPYITEDKISFLSYQTLKFNFFEFNK